MTTLASSTSDSTDNGLPLLGLDGANPLGFLAALGLLRLVTTATDGGHSTRMAWESAGSTWRPRLFSAADNEEDLLDLLDQSLVNAFDQHPLSHMPIFDETDPTQRRQAIADLVTAANSRHHDDADWIASLASDATSPDANNQIQTVRRDYFQRNLESVIERTARSHLKRSLFHVWDYADALANQSLRFDPSEDRQHAYQWNKPSGDPARNTSGGMLGANRLAIEALPLFVSIPEGERLYTLGFSGVHSHDTRWTWPLWQQPADMATTRSLLALLELQEEKPSGKALQQLRARGIVAALRTRRILVGKTPNFTPPQRIA